MARYCPARIRSLAVLALAGIVVARLAVAEPTVDERIDPTEISLGEAARLTITVSRGNSTITPPVVPGLAFLAIGQSQQIQSINGVTTSSLTVTYEVIPQEAGIFTIPNLAQSSQPLVLRVNPSANAPGSAAPGNNPRASGQSSGTTRATPDYSAFVRLHVTKNELYVGESLPVDIQVGMRDGAVASMNGLPTLNGDAFTLSKLSPHPERTEEVIDGKSFTVLTWHSILSAFKPGQLSLTMESPLTVRMRAQLRSPGGAMDDFINDPFFQNFFGAATEKEITVASAPTTFSVLPLPAEGRPGNFTGAVGTFQIGSELSGVKTVAGDPLTLRVHVTGAGSFDRINDVMLTDVDHWKTYQPTSKFKPSDDIGYRGEKTFEQPVIAVEPGTQTLPGLAFSYFDPKTHRYETARTEPLSVAVSPAPAGSAVAGNNQPAASVSPTAQEPQPGLRPDHAESGPTVSTLRPLYLQPHFLALPGGLLCALCGAWLWLRRADRRAMSAADASTRASPETTEALVGRMEAASAAGNAAVFFDSARAALQRSLATRWHVEPDQITLADVDARLGGESDVRRVFALADETKYSGRNIESGELRHWQRIVLRQLNGAQA
jgi:oxygen tolerance protein BatD